MTNSLHLYSNLARLVDQWLPRLRKTRRATLAWMIAGLERARHVHLSKIAACRVGPATLPSKVRQLRRFLANPAIDPEALYAPVASRLLGWAAGSGRLRLLVDTLELPGRRQVLMVALAFRRRALPLLWHVRCGKGASDAATQIRVLSALLAHVPAGADVVVVGDGEFHSTGLMAWLTRHGWHFCLRLHGDTHVETPDGSWSRVDALVHPGERRYLQGVRLVRTRPYGPVNLALAWRTGEARPWLIATDGAAGPGTLRTYSRRMWIEQLFGDLEGGGFRLEQSRLRERERLARLLLALALAYLWLAHVGTYVIKRGWRRSVDRNDRRDRSVIGIGRLWIQRCLTRGDPPRVGLQPYFT